MAAGLLVSDADEEPVHGSPMGFCLAAVLGFQGVAILLPLEAEQEMEPSRTLLKARHDVSPYAFHTNALSLAIRWQRTLRSCRVAERLST